MKTVFKIMLGITFASLLLMGGCAALIGGAATQVEKENDKSAISKAQFDAVAKGSMQADVTETLAPAVPSNTQESEFDSGETGLDLDSTCIYYNKSTTLEGMYQFCFDGSGKLTSKGSY